MRKNTIILFLFNLVNTSAQFAVIMILSHYLLKEDYGTYRQFFLPFEIVAPILGLGLSSSIFYFYPRFEDKNKLLQISLSIVLILCLAFQIILSIGMGSEVAALLRNESLINYFYLIGIFSFFSVANTILYSYFILEDSAKNSLIINLIGNVLMVGLLFVIIFYANSLNNILILRTGIYGMLFFMMIFSSNIFKSFYTRFIDFTNDLIKVFSYSFPIALSLFIGVLSYKFDKFLVSYFSTPSQFALYINGAFEVPLISIVTSSIAGASFGLFTTYCKNKDYNSANVLFRKSSSASAIILFPSFVFLFIYAESVITLLFGVKYVESYPIFRVFLFLLPIRIIQYGNVLIALNKTKILLIRSIIELIIGSILGILFYYFFGIIGVAVAVVLSVLLWSVPLNLIIISKGFGISLKNIIPYNSLIKIFISSVSPLIFLFILDYFTSYSNSDFIKISVMIPIYTILYLSFLFLLRIIGIDRNIKGKFKLL